MAERVGNQSVVVVMNVRKKLFGNKYEIWTHNGTKNTGMNPVDFAIEMEKLGAGEIVINSIDSDGVMKGYDLNLIQKVRDVVNIPMTIMGGAGSLEDIGTVIKQHGIIGAAAGSLFVFKGKYRAVLISYPNKVEKGDLIISNFLDQ